MTEYYVSGCIEKDGNCETCADDAAQFWTLYERDEKGESQAVADFTDRLSAEAAMRVYQERDALQQQVNTLAAEVNAVREQSEEVYDAGYNHGHLNTVDGIAYAPGTKDDFYPNSLQLMAEIETPVFDAIKRQWKAAGVEMLTGKLQQLIDEGVFDAKEIGVAAGAVYEGAQMAAQLRQPEEKGQ